jgi:hypothetical protein
MRMLRVEGSWRGYVGVGWGLGYIGRYLLTGCSKELQLETLDSSNSSIEIFLFIPAYINSS